MIEKHKDYAKLVLATEVSQICNPLFHKTPINGYQFTRLFNDGSRIFFSSDIEWTELFLSQKLYQVAKLCNNPDFYQNGFYIWDHWGRKDQSYVECGKIAEDYYDHGHGMSIVKKYNDYCDIFEMSVPQKNFHTDEFYLANLDLLENFSRYFIERAGKLIASAEKNRFILDLPPVDNSSDVEINVEQGLVALENMKLPSPELYAKLTDREKEVLAWFFQGKTAPEIAIILGISTRTVEKFVLSIKAKLECDSLFQLGAKLSPLQYRLMLEEFIATNKIKK